MSEVSGKLYKLYFSDWTLKADDIIIYCENLIFRSSSEASVSSVVQKWRPLIQIPRLPESWLSILYKDSIPLLCMSIWMQTFYKQVNPNCRKNSGSQYVTRLLELLCVICLCFDLYPCHVIGFFVIGVSPKGIHLFYL